MKTRNTEKSISLLKSVRVRSQAKLLPPKLKRQQRITTYQSRNSGAEIVHRNQCWGMETLPVIDKSLEANCGQVREIKNSRGTHSHFVGFTCRSSSIPHSKYWRKIPSCSGRRWRKGTILKYTRAFCS